MEIDGLRKVEISSLIFEINQTVLLKANDIIQNIVPNIF
jgi:hypothetical protein